MILGHFIALFPLFVFLIISMIWWKRGLLHLLLICYSGALVYLSVMNAWELLVMVPAVASVIIGLLLFAISMTKGDLI